MRHTAINTVIQRAALIFVIALGHAQAADVVGLQQLQADWAHVRYEVPPNAQVRAYEALDIRANALVEANPGAAEPMIWRAIILSTEAGAKGGLGALSLVKEARDLLERSLALNPQALNGSAHTTLGSLYYQVPGWPIGFGDEDKAREHLEQAVALNPDGIDSHYFYGDFLMQQGEFAKARAHFEKALGAKDRPGREVADAGRRAEIRAKLAELDKQG